MQRPKKTMKDHITDWFTAHEIDFMALLIALPLLITVVILYFAILSGGK